MRVTQKISSVCKYCCCSTVVTMVCMHAEFVDSFFRTVFTHRAVFIMFKKIENPTACEMQSVIRFLNVKNIKPAEIRQLCDVYRQHVTSSSIVWRTCHDSSNVCRTCHEWFNCMENMS